MHLPVDSIIQNKNMFFEKIYRKYLVMSENNITFALAFGNNINSSRKDLSVWKVG